MHQQKEQNKCCKEEKRAFSNQIKDESDDQSARVGNRREETWGHVKLAAAVKPSQHTTQHQ